VKHYVFLQCETHCFPVVSSRKIIAQIWHRQLVFTAVIPLLNIGKHDNVKTHISLCHGRQRRSKLFASSWCQRHRYSPFWSL